MSPPFRYYCDGEYEYRVERGLADSGAVLTVHAGARHGLAALVPNLPGTRVWKLADRPVVPPKITIIDGCDPPCVDDGSHFVKGQLQPPTNAWQPAGEIYLPNEVDDFDVAAKRLLGSELLAACEATDTDAGHQRRRTAENARFGL